MINLSDKQGDELIDVSVGLSNIVANLPFISGSVLAELEERYNIPNYMEKAKQFLYVPKINEMVASINRAYKQADDLVELSIGLYNFTKIVNVEKIQTISRPALTKLEKEHHLADYMEKAKQFLYVSKINEIVEEINEAYALIKRNISKP